MKLLGKERERGMIKLNGVEIKLDKYPDGTFLFKNIPSSIGGWHRSVIEWFFDSMEEFAAVVYIARYCWDHKVMPYLYMPYIPNARMDRVKKENEIFTLKYFAQTINSLHFDKVEVLDPHSDVSVALFNKIHVESPNRMIETAVKKIASDNLMMFYPDAGSMKRYSSAVHLPYTFGIKNRDWFLYGGANNKIDILIVDDICSKGGTFYHSALKLKELGAANIYLYVTHCENSIYDGELLKNNGLIEKIYTTDSILTNTESPKIELVEEFRKK